jgi:uncharacterized protein involved in outer membrane biogenesis
MNNFLLYMGGLLIAALAVLFAVPHFVDWNSYRGVFEAEASRILGRELRVGGAVNVRFLPVPYVSFEKIRIADPGGESGSIIRIDSFTMWLSVPPLLRGVLEAHQVELRRPVLQLATDASGSGNWRTLSMNPGAMPFVPKDVALQSVRILDGAVVVNGPNRNELARLADITGELAAEALDGPYKFKGSLKWDGELRQVRFATAKQDPSGDVRFKAAVDAPASGNSYVLDGRVRDLKAAPKLDGDLTAKLALAPPTSPPAEKPVPEVAPTGAPPATAPIKGDALAPPAIEGAAPDGKAASPATPAAPAAPTAGKPEFDFRAKVTGDTAGVELSDLSATIDTGTGVPQLIAGSAKLSWNDKMRLDVRLDSRWIDLDRLMNHSSSEVPLEAARGLFETVAAALPDEADTNATLDFDQLTLGGEPISNVHFAASRAGGPLEIKGVRASLPGGTRLQLEGVLTPGGEVPRIDGTVFVSGQSLLRFLGWGFRKPDIGTSRTDGPFALDGRFMLAENVIELTNATAEISETPVAGAVKLSLGQRKQLSVSLEGSKVDATQIRSGILGLGTVKSLFLGESPAEKDAAAEGIDLALKLKLAELADGDRILRDVDAEMSIERGTLSMPRLKFSTPEGLAIDAEGSAKDVVSHPQGAIRAVVSAPNEGAAKAFIRLLDLEAADQTSVERLSRLTPMRVAATLTLHSGETNTSHLAIDGSMGGGRIIAALQLQGGRDGWRKSPADITATITSPNVESLVSALFDARTPAASSASPQQPGQLLLKAAGTPSSGLLTMAEITSDTFSLDYNGRISLPAPDQTAASGTLRVSSADAQSAFALAGLKLGEATASVPLAATLSLDLKDKKLALDTHAMTLGASTIGGKVTMAPTDTGGRTVDASLVADTASFSSLLGAVLARESAEPSSIEPPSPQPVRRDAKPTPSGPGAVATEAAPVEIWPEQAFDLSALDRLSGKVSARIGSLKVEPGLSITDASLEASFGPKGISVTKLEGTAIGGKLSSKLDFEKALAGVGLNGSLRIDIASTPAATAAAGPGTPGDVAALAVDFSGRALSPAALMASLTGKGSVTAGDATLTGMSPTAVSGVVEAALSGKGPAGGEPLMEAVKAAAKEGEVKLGKIDIPIVIGDGAVKLDKVTLDAADGRSTFSSVIDLASMKLDSEWQIEPKLNRPSAAAQARPYLPAVTVVYTGKLSALSALEPTVSTAALERELSVRKMERDVDQLESLRKQDQARARQERERQERDRQERERRKALEAAPQPPQQAPPTGWNAPNTTKPGEDATVDPDPSAGADFAPPANQAPGANAAQPLDPDDIPANGSATASAAPDATAPGSTAPRPQRRRKPVNDEWRPFQTTPY